MQQSWGGGGAKFLGFYAEARKTGLREQCVRFGWEAIGLCPKNVKKPLVPKFVKRNPVSNNCSFMNLFAMDGSHA